MRANKASHKDIIVKYLKKLDTGVNTEKDPDENRERSSWKQEFSMKIEKRNVRMKGKGGDYFEMNEEWIVSLMEMI